MRRTYRSKKHAGGALDHRDMLLNLDEKSSAFDAFYIQNLKQTKRELSCVVSSNQVGVASNKVHKRKYVKRLVKEAEPIRQRETLSSSAYLTPDKSIRVNKILDPFDMLLNSSPAPQQSPLTHKVETVKTFVPKKESKTYVRKRKPRVKKFNYSNTESDKENSVDLNTTDFKTHELLVERVPNESPKCVDESIHKIVNNLSLINNLKQKCSIVSFNTSYKTRLSKNYQSPNMQKSPLCSTPFKEKYRGVSIFKFSPITQKEQMSPSLEEKDDSNHSIILVSKTLALKSSNNYKVSPMPNIPNISIQNKTNLSENDYKENISAEDKMQNEIVCIDYQKHSSTLKDEQSSCQVTEAEPYGSSTSNNEQSSCQITKAEPFLGFSSNVTMDITKEKMESMLKRLNHQSLQDVDIDKTELVSNQSDSKDLSNIDTVENDSVSSSSNFNIVNKNDSEANTNNSSNSSNFDMDENQLESNNTSDQSKSTTNTSVASNKSNITESTVHTQSSDSESLYDTCDSDQSSITNDSTPKKEPLVAIEKMNDSIFQMYYEKMLKSQNEEVNDLTNIENFTSLVNSNDETMNEANSEHLDSDEFKVNPIVITDSSTTDDVLSSEEFTCGEESNDQNEKYVSFVTTRRRNEITKDSMFQFDQSYVSSSTDCDKTVLSNKSIINNSVKIDVENIQKNNFTKTNIEDKEHFDDNENNKKSKMLSRKSTRESKLSNTRNTLSPHYYNDFKNKNIANENMSMINTRRERRSRTSRLSNTTSIVSPISKSKQCMSPSSKKVSRISKKSFLIRHSASTNVNGENKDTIRYSTAANNIVFENDSYCMDNRNSKSPLSAENISCMLKETVVSCPGRSSYAGTELKPSIVLQAGKKWERSLSIYKRMTIVADHFDQSILEDDCKQNKGRRYRESVINTMEMQEYRDSLHNDSINSRRSTFVSNLGRPTIRFVKDPNFSRVSLNTTSVFDDLKGFLSEECDDTVIELSKLSIADSELEVTILDNFHETTRVTTARDYVLRRCNQTEPLLFDDCYPETVLKNCHKIGEGVYGEVFLWRGRDGRARVMKIVPIAGAVKVNGEHQKDFHEIISEIVIAMELSALRAPIADIERQLDEGHDIHALELHAIENATDIFNEVLAVRCVHGPYPSRLLDLWELYDECKGSENDNPAALPTDQRYIVLELANAGQDLESYQFASAQQAHALFQQIAFGLAVAEEAFQFEHRDLHWGNVLIAPTEQKFATFVLRGRAYRVPRRGVAATVIDYSLSRLSLPLAEDCAALYNDLAADEQLFDAVGDYQFELYRLMRDKLGNDWKNFEPYTNILWLHYTVDKMITALRYKRTNTKIHKHYIEKLKGIKNTILEYGSAVQYVLTDIDF